MSHTIYNLMLDYADHIDLINLSEEIPNQMELERHIQESFSTFCKSFTECVSDDYVGAAIDCFYNQKGVSSFCLSAEGNPENLKNVAQLYKLKPKNFPYEVQFLRDARPVNELYELQTKIMNTKGELVKVSDTKAIEIGLIPEATGTIKIVVFYHGDSAFRFVASEAKAFLNHSIGEYPYIANISGLYIVPNDDVLIDCERFRLKDIVSHYEKACWKVGVTPYPEAKVDFN
jgi:hypothetical protein